MFSPYQENIKNKYNISIGQVSKLVPTLMDKKSCPPLQKPKVESRSWLEDKNT